MPKSHKVLLLVVVVYVLVLWSSLIAKDVTGAAVGRGKESSPRSRARSPLQKKEKCKMLLARANLHSVFGAIAIPPPPPPPPPPITSSISDGGPAHPELRQRKGSGASRPDQIPYSRLHSSLQSSLLRFWKKPPQNISTHAARAREESHAFTPRPCPPTRRISDFFR